MIVYAPPISRRQRLLKFLARHRPAIFMLDGFCQLDPRRTLIFVRREDDRGRAPARLPVDRDAD